ncbi:DUF4401 domain-containing protein [Myroides sp. N17-2]|uniref:DUF4401 domain-containing protein n=1 Tax=Myroides sp. N17-2 TaxID=2030799 RepID=UPI000EFC4648|nr:DUF4401 domain-containing protein [Myroides sp. N17-2]
MSKSNFKTLVSSLEQSGVEINHESLTEATDKGALKSIIIRVVSVLGSLLGLGLFIGFIALISADLFRNQAVLTGIGIAFLVGAFFFNRSKDSAITDSIAVSLYIIGHSFLIYGLTGDSNIGGYIALATSIITLCVYNNQIISFLSTLGVLISIHVVMFSLHIENFYYIYLAFVLLFAVYLFWQEQQIRTQNNILRERYLPVFTAFFCYTLVMGIIASTEDYGYYYFSEYSAVRVFLLLVILGLILATVYLLLDKMKVTQLNTKIIVYLFALVFTVLIAFNYPAFGIAFLFLLWSFKQQFKAGIALSIATFIWAMGMFYYDLGLTLLEKSISMMIVGVVFLGVYYLIQKKGAGYDKV